MLGNPVFYVVKPGLQTTIQDQGRFGYQQYGVSPSGVMDHYASRIANILVGNNSGEAVIEAAMIGPVLQVVSDCVISICGGNLSPAVDGVSVPLWKSFRLNAGQVLTFGHLKEGARAYIAVSGGFTIEPVLGSKSTYLAGGFGGIEGRALQKGDWIYAANPGRGTAGRSLTPSLIPRYQQDFTVRAIPGPHTAAFESVSVDAFYGKMSYTISTRSNRMGVMLEGPALVHKGNADILSDAVPFGGIQVPSGGQPIILMAERQPTGGYTRIGTVITVDLPLIAQAIPGSTVRFKQISVEQAQKELQNMNKLLQELELAAGVYCFFR